MGKRKHPVAKVLEPWQNDKARAFLSEYEALCKKHGLALVPHGRIQPVEGSIFKLVGVHSIEPLADERTAQ